MMQEELNPLVPHPIELAILGVLLMIGVALFAWWLIMLIEALRIPSQQWEAAGHNQIIYVIAMFLLGIIGTILYMLIPRAQLKATAGV